MVLVSDLLIIVGVAVVLLISRSLATKKPEKSEYIARSAYRISTIITIIFGVLAETIVVLTILWTIDFI